MLCCVCDCASRSLINFDVGAVGLETVNRDDAEVLVKRFGAAENEQSLHGVFVAE